MNMDIGPETVLTGADSSTTEAEDEQEGVDSTADKGVDTSKDVVSVAAVVEDPTHNSSQIEVWGME